MSVASGEYRALIPSSFVALHEPSNSSQWLPPVFTFLSPGFAPCLPLREHPQLCEFFVIVTSYFGVPALLALACTLVFCASCVHGAFQRLSASFVHGASQWSLLCWNGEGRTGQEAVFLDTVRVVRFGEEENIQEAACVICRSQYENGAELRMLPCGHTLHLQVRTHSPTDLTLYQEFRASFPVCCEHSVGCERRKQTTQRFFY